MLILLIIVLLLALSVFLYLKSPIFGKTPSGERLELLKRSRNFNDGKFRNFSVTPELAEGYNMAGLMYAHFFKKATRRYPSGTIPSAKTDLLNLPPGSNVLVWFGHSSYFIQIDRKRILVDPVLSGNASPIRGTNRSFKGTDIYSLSDLPDIDFLFITHDHYDHVDYPTLVGLRSRITKVICGLGVGAHFESWGYEADCIEEKDWYEKTDLGDGIIVYTEPARHFSGRGFSRNNTLWLSYVLQTPSKRLYLGGDSGYDSHFGDIGKKYGPIDLAILDNGQYNAAWPYIHMHPEEVLKAAKDLKANRIFPVHSSKFVMANHPWDEPLRKITELNKEYNIPLVTPIIGEPVNLDDVNQPFTEWWTGIN